jgi:PST family polysaccharide transporter
MWGASALGYYSKAYNLMTLPVFKLSDTVGRVMLPALSAISSDPTRMASAYRRAVRAIAFAGVPMAIGLALTAPETVRVLYGPAWEPVVPILTWLSFSMIALFIGTTTSWLYMVSGRTKIQFLMNLAGTVMLLIGFAVGSRFGVEGIAAAYTIHSLVFTIPLLAVAHRVSGISLKVTFGELWPILAIAGAMGLLVFGVGTVANELWHNWAMTFMVKVITGVIAYGTLSLWCLRPLPLPLPDRLRSGFGRLGVSL